MAPAKVRLQYDLRVAKRLGIASAIKGEIVRLSRKELKQHIKPLKKAPAGFRRDIAALKRRVVELERENGSLRKRLPVPAPLVAKGSGPTKIRFVPAGIPALRKRLAITSRTANALEQTLSDLSGVVDQRLGRSDRATIVAFDAEHLGFPVCLAPAKHYEDGQDGGVDDAALLRVSQ